MKNFITIIIIVLFAFVFKACDTIEGPYIEEGTTVWNGRKSVLFDFTGHTCGNCPEGHLMIDELVDTYGEALIPIAVHCGWYSTPTTSDTTQPNYYDFRTDIGLQLGGDGVSSGGDLNIQIQPIGLVNTLEGGDNLQSVSGWASAFAPFIEQYPKYSVELEGNYNSEDNTLNTNVEISALTADVQDINIVVYVVESNIIQWQTDYSQNPQHVENYVHNHVLRGSFNGTYGTNIGAVATYSNNYQMYLGNDWVPENCSIIAFVMNNSTKEVLQAEELNLGNSH